MEQQLRDHVERMFERAPRSRSAVELKEEVLQNLLEKYRDLLEEGKPPESAYNLTVAGLGDMEHLIADLWNQESRREPNSQEVEQARRRAALLTALGVMCIILCVVPVLLDLRHAVVWLFVMVAVGVGILIFNSMTKPMWLDEDNMVGDFRAWQSQDNQQKQLTKSIHAAVWAVALALYFLISFTSFRWHITWVIFPLAAAVNSLITALLDLRQNRG